MKPYKGSPELRAAEETIQKAHSTAAKLVSKDGVKMADAAKQTLSAPARHHYLGLYVKFPVQIQHIAAANLWIMEGVCLMEKEKRPEAALEAYEKAAAIKEAVRGSLSFERAKDLWRIVGASMACGRDSSAELLLTTIWHEFFADNYIKDPQHKFSGWTVFYALPWWQSRQDERKAMLLKQLALKAAKSS